MGRERQIIEMAGRRLQDKQHWCQGALARTKTGKPRRPVGATKCCILGELYRQDDFNPDNPAITRTEAADRAAVICQWVAQKHYGMDAAQVNDQLGHAAAMDVLRKAWMWAKQNEDD